MPSQIFKQAVPQSIFMDFIKRYAEKKQDCYQFSIASYKRAQHEKTIEPLCLSLLEYYFVSKRFYLTRPMNYRNLITIIRQLCKYYKVLFTSSIHYSNSKYSIVYSIYAESGAEADDT